MADLPQKFGNYTLHQLIARGGMAEIYRATMPGIGGFEKTVAIKKILPHLAENEEFITMLKDEANILVSINDSNIAQVYDLGLIEDTYFISMEYVHGLDLSHVLKGLQKRGAQIPLEHALYISSCMCAGLHAAHTNTDRQGNPLHIVHRDVSPHNVLISFAGDVKLIDFGVAKAALKESHTQMGVIKGKLLYMAPEQAMAKSLDGRADLFAVGLCMYKMLTNELPFSGDNEFQIYNNILSKEIIPPRELNPDIPQEVNQVVMTLLQRDPDKRYQDGFSAKQDLRRALHNISPGYTVSRLGRFIEDNFSEVVRRRQQALQDSSGPSEVSPQTPSALSVGTGQLLADSSGQPARPAPPLPGDPTREQVRAPSSPPKTPAPTPAPRLQADDPLAALSAPGAPGELRTQGSNADTGSMVLKDLKGAQATSGTGSKHSPVLYLTAVLALLIVAMLAYATLIDPKDDSITILEPNIAPEPSAPKAPPPPSALIKLTLESDPQGADIYQDEQLVGTTPAQLMLRRADAQLHFTLQLDGYEEQTISLRPDDDQNKRVALNALDDTALEDDEQPDEEEDAREAKEAGDNIAPAQEPAPKDKEEPAQPQQPAPKEKSAPPKPAPRKPAPPKPAPPKPEPKESEEKPSEILNPFG